MGQIISIRARPVAGARPYAVMLPGVADNLNIDLAESFVRIGRRIVGHRIGIPQVLPDRFERLDLFLPRFRPVGLAAGAGRDPLEHVA